MRRTIPVLRGLAILGVVFNHANWHVLSRYPAGEIGGIPFIAFDQVGKFAIVAFMFIAGYFTAYATSGGKRDLSWGIVRARLENLLWPWLIWAAIFMAGQFVQGRPLSVAEYARTLFIQYYFIPLLMFYYLLAPAIARWARTNSRSLLIIAAVVQIVGIVVFYLRVYWPSFPPALHSWIDIGPLQYLRFAFAFPLGMVAGIHPKETKTVLEPWKRPLPWMLLVLFILSAAETIGAYTYAADHPSIWPMGVIKPAFWQQYSH